MGQVVLTIEEGKGVVRVQLRATSPSEERRSVALYRMLKPIIETINVHVPPSRNPGGRRRGPEI